MPGFLYNKEYAMEIRKSKMTDLDKIMPLFDLARATMKTLGIDQWQDGYPYRENIEEDIRNEESYVVTDGEEIIATFMLMRRNEPTYNTIFGGKWLDDGEEYATVHRITVSPARREKSGNSKGTPVSRIIMDYAKAYSAEQGLPAGVKIDTHEGNIAMRKMLEKNGFVHCGTILLANGHERVAYQYIERD